MLAPSVLSAMVHSIWDDFADSSPSVRYESEGELLSWLARIVASRKRDWPSVPIVARTDAGPSWIHAFFGEHVRIAGPRDTAQSSGGFFWGRVPVDRLIRYGAERHDTVPDRELIDLGVGLQRGSAGAGGGADAECARLLGNTASAGHHDVCVAIIDSGDAAPGRSPNDYGKTLHHAVTVDVVMSAHAVEVLALLLQRLQPILHRARVHCALMKPPAAPIGLHCFEHDGSCEMLDAVQSLDAALAAETVPIAVNMSLGTHVGPHNGVSPLEEALVHLMGGAQRFVHVAAGNEGLRGLAARACLGYGPRHRHDLRFQIGADGSEELLVEIWWHDDPAVAVTVEVETSRARGGALHLGKLVIDSRTKASFAPFVQPAAGALPLRRSLFHAACHGSMSCIAFMLSAGAANDLAGVIVDLTVRASAHLDVQCWAPVCADVRSTFAGADVGGTIVVPSTHPDIVCVAGVDAGGDTWRHSPAGHTWRHAPAGKTRVGPRIACRVDSPFSADEGTSYASPRACAEAAMVLVDPIVAARCRTADDLVAEILGGGPLGPRDARVGYGVKP